MVFEGPMIIVAVTLLTVLHPGRVFKGLWDRAGQAGQGIGRNWTSTRTGKFMVDEEYRELDVRSER